MCSQKSLHSELQEWQTVNVPNLLTAWICTPHVDIYCLSLFLTYPELLSGAVNTTIRALYAWVSLSWWIHVQYHSRDGYMYVYISWYGPPSSLQHHTIGTNNGVIKLYCLPPYINPYTYRSKYLPLSASRDILPPSWTYVLTSYLNVT